jgi:hypothetical protein
MNKWRSAGAHQFNNNSTIEHTVPVKSAEMAVYVMDAGHHYVTFARLAFKEQ